MKANEFVKKFGLSEAKRVVNDSTEQCTHYDKIKNNDFWFDNNLRLEWCSFECRWCSPRFQINESELVSVDDLKRIVDSHELVDGFGGLGRVKKVLDGKHIGYTHFYLHSNDRYVFLDHYVDFIPDQAQHIGMFNKVIADVESCL